MCLFPLAPLFVFFLTYLGKIVFSASYRKSGREKGNCFGASQDSVSTGRPSSGAMALPWGIAGNVASVTQLAGIDAVHLIGLIVEAASTARKHKRICQQFAKQLRLVGNLLHQLSVSELKKHHSTREPLELLEDALRRSYILVNSCQDRSYLYLLVMGMQIQKQFRSVQCEISQYLDLIPLITLVDIQRVKERTENIKMDQIEYTLDEANKMQDAPSNPEFWIPEMEISTEIVISNKDGLCTRVLSPKFNDAVLQIFKFNELKNATRNFRHKNIVGGGGFWAVYKGWINNNSLKAANNGPYFLMPGSSVAVKRFSHPSRQALLEWEAEVRLLGSMSHPNVTKLLGYCREKGGNLLLVYEYMDKGSLSGQLGKVAAFQLLSWELRIKIAVGVARALVFLHTSHIVHGDNFNPRLSNFRPARNGPSDRDTYVEDVVIGTLGYVDPKYYREGLLNEKADVFGFGIVLMEMFSGKKVVDMLETKLSDYQELASLKDPRLHGQYPLRAARLVAQLAASCVAFDPAERPYMKETLKTLEEIQTMDISPTKLAPTEVSDPCPFLHDINYSVCRTMVYESAPFDADTELSFSNLRLSCSGAGGGVDQRMWWT